MRQQVLYIKNQENTADTGDIVTKKLSRAESYIPVEAE